MNVVFTEAAIAEALRQSVSKTMGREITGSITARFNRRKGGVEIHYAVDMDTAPSAEPEDTQVCQHAPEVAEAEPEQAVEEVEKEEEVAVEEEEEEVEPAQEVQPTNSLFGA